jgi:hypothetical protein
MYARVVVITVAISQSPTGASCTREHPLARHTKAVTVTVAIVGVLDVFVDATVAIVIDEIAHLDAGGIDGRSRIIAIGATVVSTIGSAIEAPDIDEAVAISVAVIRGGIVNGVGTAILIEAGSVTGLLCSAEAAAVIVIAVAAPAGRTSVSIEVPVTAVGAVVGVAAVFGLVAHFTRATRRDTAQTPPRIRAWLPRAAALYAVAVELVATCLVSVADLRGPTRIRLDLCIQVTAVERGPRPFAGRSECNQAENGCREHPPHMSSLFVRPFAVRLHRCWATMVAPDCGGTSAAPQRRRGVRRSWHCRACGGFDFAHTSRACWMSCTVRQAISTQAASGTGPNLTRGRTPQLGARVAAGV